MRNGLIGIIKNTLNNVNVIDSSNIHYYTNPTYPFIQEPITIFSPKGEIVRLNTTFKKIIGIWETNGNISLGLVPVTVIPAGCLLFQEYTYSDRILQYTNKVVTNTDRISVFSLPSNSDAFGFIILCKITATPGGNFSFYLNNDLYSSSLTSPSFYLLNLYLGPFDNLEAIFTTNQTQIEANIWYLNLGTNTGGI